MNLQHASLTVERWSQFSLDRRILMIGNEMNRALKLFAPSDRELLRTTYERILRLTDLTVEAGLDVSHLLELLRWREFAASQYVAEAPDVELHKSLFRVLLLMSPVAALQIRELPALKR